MSSDARVRGKQRQPSEHKTVAERLLYGRDWHGWAWKDGQGFFGTTCYVSKPTTVLPCGKTWVRIKFVEL
jgi:hypothetical protein